MINKYKKCFVPLVVCALTSHSFSAIMSSEARAEQLKIFKEILDREVTPLEDKLFLAVSNPFVPNHGKVAAVEVEEAVVLSDEELLESLATYVNPTGIFMFGGEFYLIFNEKRLKVGSELGVKLNGVDYIVTIAEITGSTYKISRGETELQLKLK